MSRRIYLASSWRNEYQPELVEQLRDAGHEVYDFRNPPDGSSGFSWAEIDPNWESWTANQFRDALEHPIAQEGFDRDFAGMLWADAFVCLLPSGKSAHLEAGWATGRGVPTVFAYPERQEPELMAKLGDGIMIGIAELLDWLDGLKPSFGPPVQWGTHLANIRFDRAERQTLSEVARRAKAGDHIAIVVPWPGSPSAHLAIRELTNAAFRLHSGRRFTAGDGCVDMFHSTTMRAIGGKRWDAFAVIGAIPESNRVVVEVATRATERIGSPA